MKQKHTHHGFTLVELLVVIAIIAILAGILLPTVIGAFKKASEAQARTEVKSIETAIKQYFAEYGKYPDNNAKSDKVYGPDNRDIIGILRGTNTSASANNPNPRKIVFLEVNENSLKNPSTGVIDNNFYDPWGQEYRICFDSNFDNIVKTGVDGIGDKAGRTILVWSLGIEGGTNFIKSWE